MSSRGEVIGETQEGAEEEESEEEEAPPLVELSEACHVILEDDFLPSDLARDLRGVFDKRFADPRSISPERFMWDYWHIPDQYTLGREGGSSREGGTTSHSSQV